ncbi:lysophospholipid acyltransferase family protein [Flagellimonas iocasae]|uniref:Lysophospholipid acyltransferase family protein n=1 Tax=Flagellimonas iocasae TaxID=2055905 RepID=A0ABW4Y4T6_9FLAO
MKKLGYFVIKFWASAGLFCYYHKIKVIGRENIPEGKPVLFLSNHQNALMDVLLVATRCNKKPWFLTRSDVFTTPLLRSFFRFLQMLPIYRMRDGKDNLLKNEAIFRECSQLFQNHEAILVFPEANHSLQRRVRPLSKGFTRIISAALEENPSIDLQLVPVGQNYAYPTQVGDSAVLHFGEPIAIQKFLNSSDFSVKIKQAVEESLQRLTTHIPEADYESTIQKIGEEGNIFLHPERVNKIIAQQDFEQVFLPKRKILNKIFRALFLIWNLPFVLLWRILLKPKVPEAEFMATFRFGFILVAYPIFYGIALLTLWNMYSIKTACLVVLGHAVINIVLVKMGITSSAQRK